MVEELVKQVTNMRQVASVISQKEKFRNHRCEQLIPTGCHELFRVSIPAFDYTY
jgi:hypothetical protein